MNMNSRLFETLLSSSSDEEEEVKIINWMESEMSIAAQLVARNERHSVSYFQEVIKSYSDEEFRKHFRISRRTAAILTDKFSSSRFFKKKPHSSGRMHISAEIQILFFLWFAGNKESYREVANLFNITNSSVYRCQTRVLEFLFEISPRYIKMPSTTTMKENVSRNFAKIAGFQNVLGCVDGSYIYIRKPAHKIRSTYVNRHGLISITLQGICDADKKFLDVFVGASSKIHDSRIFKLSPISKQLPTICENRYHILGDAAYPIREYLLTPYRDFGDLTNTKRAYNKKHCQTRVKIENTFGLLKQRFRQLVRLDYFTVERMSKFVLGCCVLHNLCIDEADLWTDMPEDRSSHSQQENTRTQEENEIEYAALRADGERKRDAIADAFR